jgi:alkylation response protein AidB-like acyl-CoA dehydrogenase
MRYEWSRYMDRIEVRLQDYSLDEDQESVRDAFSEFFAKEAPTTVARAAEPLGFDPELWQKLLNMGVASMSLPASVGGDDATLVELVLIAEEVGRSVAPVPFVSHIVATRLLAAANADAGIIQEAIAGEKPFAVALAPAVAGQRQLVPDAAIAADVIALEGDELVLTRAHEAAAHVPNQGSTPLAWWQPAGDAERIVLASGAAAAALYSRAVSEWKLLTAAALIGMTESALKLAVEFAKTRETMGVPIGSLQGVAFPLADIAIGLSGGRNLIWRAAWMTEHEPQTRPELVPMAFAYAAQVATHGTTTAAHMHGGLGFTIEADASLFFLRAKGWSVLGGDPKLDLVAVGNAVLAGAQA